MQNDILKHVYVMVPLSLILLTLFRNVNIVDLTLDVSSMKLKQGNAKTCVAQTTGLIQLGFPNHIQI